MGLTEGLLVGIFVGASDGFALRIAVGDKVTAMGKRVGEGVGLHDGTAEETVVGKREGFIVGAILGVTVREWKGE